MPDTNTAVRVAGTWLAVASLLLTVALISHGPLAPDLGEQMQMVAGRAQAWVAIHLASAAALSLFALAGLIALTSGSRLVRGWWPITAWGFLTISALWTMTTAVAEATAVTNAAVSGDREMFEAWWAFAEGKATGIAFLALAVAVISASEARSPDRAVPAWSAWLATVAGILSFAGWALGRWLGVNFGNLLWVASSVVMCLWTLWFGFALSRNRAATV